VAKLCWKLKWLGFFWDTVYLYKCPENFWESLTTLTANFPELLIALLYRLVLWMRVHNLKFVALPLPEMLGEHPKLGSPWIRPRSFFVQNFNGLIIRMDTVNVPAKLEIGLRSFTRYWDNRLNNDWSSGWGLRTPIVGKRTLLGIGDGSVRKSVGDFL